MSYPTTILPDDENCESCGQPLVDPALTNRFLLAQMAATIAAGIACQADGNTERWCVEEPERTHGPIADIAVSIARRILDRVERPATHAKDEQGDTSAKEEG